MDVWDEVIPPADAHIIKGRWVYVIKENPDHSLEYRARWVARGDSQLADEYNEVHATSGDYVVARLTCALASSSTHELNAIDISSAYLHSPLTLDKPIYVEFPTGLSPSTPGAVCRLKRALYGLRQGARAWQDFFESMLTAAGYQRLKSAPCAFYRKDANGETIVTTHVDDCTTASTKSGDPPHINQFKADLAKIFTFKQKDLSKLAKLLGWDVRTGETWVEISVGTKISQLLSKYDLLDANSVRTPMPEDGVSVLLAAAANDEDDDDPNAFQSLLGELLWIAVNARPDIAFAVQFLSKFSKHPKARHWLAAKRILRYLKGTQNACLHYDSNSPAFKAFCDSDWGRDPSDRKSTSGFIILFHGAPLSWKVRKQKSVALSSAEAEYLAASLCAREVRWFRSVFSELGRPFGQQPVTIYTDNQAAVKMSINPVYQSRTKHIDIHAHHLRDEVKNGSIKLEHIAGVENPADLFTKPLGATQHYKCCRLMGLII